MGPEVKRFIKARVDCLFRVYSSYAQKNRSPGDAVLLTGSPRSGTTWLYELFSSLLNTSFGIWEPLNPNKYHVLKHFEEPLRPYLKPGTMSERDRMFFSNLLKGKFHQASTMEKFDLRKFFHEQKHNQPLIIKSVRGTRILPWLADYFHLRYGFLLLRHPCAVISSQLEHGSWDYIKPSNNLKHPKIVRELLDDLPQVKELLNRRMTPEEKLAVTWGFDYYIPLKYWNKNNYYILIYEDLVDHNPEAIKAMLKVLGISSAPQKLSKLLTRKSSTTKEGDTMTQNDSLSKWKTNLSGEQVDRILTVVRHFGLDFYNESVHPDMNQLERFKFKMQ